MRDYILFFLNGQQCCARGADAFQTLSEFIRKRMGLTGTKLVCSEGDCGSCTVLCGSVNDTADTLDYAPIDSCIQFMFQLDGRHVVTIEGLSHGGPINGLQQAMIDCHGSQCGFCTPGFVMAMSGVMEGNRSPTICDWRHGLTGNLCRCTGYSPIIAAGMACDSNATPSMNQLFPATDLIREIQKHSTDEIRIEAAVGDQTQILYCPTKTRQATGFLENYPDAKIVAGGTDVGVQFNQGTCQASVWLDLNRIKSLTGIRVANHRIQAGARATWSEFESVTKKLVPQFYDIVSVFGSPQIRNVGTIGGNLINASPIADSIPFLMVCDAELNFADSATSWSVNINEFYLGYKQLNMRPGSLLVEIEVPLPPENCDLRLYKISRRKDLDISSFTAAIRIEREGDRIQHAAIAMGAVGPIVLRLPETESFLIGKQLTLETMQEAGPIAVSEISPISDVRGGEDYRRQLARNVLLKFYHETKTKGAMA